jgi:hypothetical protein
VKRLLLVLLFLLAGCGGGGTPPVSVPPMPATTPMAVPVFLRVTTGSGGSLLAVVQRNGTTRISSALGGRKVTITENGGRYTRKGRTLAVAKTYGDGVKLKSAAGRTLWRARISSGRVQVRRGEANLRYEFERAGDDRVKVKRGSTEIGDVRTIEQGSRLDLADGATLGLSSSPPGNGLAVLLCREIPPDLRAVLAAAVLARQ